MEHNYLYLQDRYNPYRLIHYLSIIKASYGDIRSNRSQVPYINHITEGIYILDYIGASEDAICAYIVHPIFQSDNDLVGVSVDDIESEIVMLCMEYRSVANEYLSKRIIGSADEIRLSPLKDVNYMLIADKIQNYKDFTIHKEKYSNRNELEVYFNNWLYKLQEYYHNGK